MTTPDRPGDRAQQQPAEVWAAALNELYEGRRPGEMALDYTARIKQILNRVRAEEAARWQAKIEALAGELAAESAAAQQRSAEMARTDENVRHHTAEHRHARVAAHTAAALRALLGGEQR